MITTMNRKLSTTIWEYALFNIFYMGSVYTNRYIMLTFASNGAGMATNTQTVIYNKSVIHKIRVEEGL
jgi:hypothetical protein|tara:strand:+ start:2916 stop:3119 length:204 start_codon:yes stop_codon:yes gene_type:complete